MEHMAMAGTCMQSSAVQRAATAQSSRRCQTAPWKDAAAALQTSPGLHVSRLVNIPTINFPLCVFYEAKAVMVPHLKARQLVTAL